MGFDVEEAQNALHASNANINQALELLVGEVYAFYDG